MQNFLGPGVYKRRVLYIKKRSALSLTKPGALVLLAGFEPAT